MKWKVSIVEESVYIMVIKLVDCLMQGIIKLEPKATRVKITNTKVYDPIRFLRKTTLNEMSPTWVKQHQKNKGIK